MGDAEDAERHGWEGLLRLDHSIPEQGDVDHQRRAEPHHRRRRLLVPPPGSVTAALLFDHEQVNNKNYRAGPRRRTPLGRAHANQFLNA